LQIIFLASLAPMALLAAAFGLGTFTVLRQVHADLDQVASAVAQSHAERAVIASFAGRATVRWLSGLGLFWVVGSATLVIQVLAYRRFSRRITRAAARAQRILTGEEEVDVRDLPIRDPLDRLEQKLEELGGEIRERRRRLESETRHQQLGAQIQQALAMSESEAEVLAVTERVLERGVATARGSLLLADSSRAHMHTIISPSDPCGVCPVESPSRCPAVRAGRTVIYPSSSDLDACPRLHGRPGGPCSAACVPVTIMGHAVGVLHVVGEDGAPPVSELLPLEVLTRHLGVRIGMIRTLETAQLQAERDPLTGLLNRRTLTARVTEIMAAGRTFSFAMLDLDHFKRLNDTAGHEVGDQALRRFAQVITRTLRPTDVIARYGGEEFAAVLPDCNEQNALVALDRVRQALAASCARALGPTFTVSVGVATSVHGDMSIDDLILNADRAMYEAKRAGRDRVVIAGCGAPAPVVVADASPVARLTLAPAADRAREPG
jgi:diguanylate cyclase (GGDEF)-like protein